MLNEYGAADFRSLSLVYAVFVLVVSFMQVPPGPSVMNIDKLLHAGLYYGFAFTLWRGFSDKRFFLAAFLYGVAIEFIQPSFGRELDFFDTLANGAGIFLFALTAKLKL